MTQADRSNDGGKQLAAERLAVTRETAACARGTGGDMRALGRRARRSLPVFDDFALLRPAIAVTPAST